MFDSRESIIAYIVDKLFKFICNEIQSGNYPDGESIDKELNIVWSKIRKYIKFEVSTNDFVIIKSLCRRVDTYFRNFGKLEVIFNNQIFDYQLEEHTIQVPITCIRSSSILNIVYIDDNIYYDDIPSSYSILGALLQELSEEITKGFKYTNTVGIYKCQSLRLYQTSKNRNVKLALENMVKGFNTVSYPRVAISTCKLCKSKESCKWYE